MKSQVHLTPLFAFLLLSSRKCDEPLNRFDSLLDCATVESGTMILLGLCADLKADLTFAWLNLAKVKENEKENRPVQMSFIALLTKNAIT